MSFENGNIIHLEKVRWVWVNMLLLIRVLRCINVFNIDMPPKFYHCVQCRPVILDCVVMFLVF